jgi:hypothetical protein
MRSLAATVLAGVLLAATALAVIYRDTLFRHADHDARQPGDMAPFVGEWHVHGEKLVIKADGTGTDLINAGPCRDAICTGYSTLTFSVVAGVAEATTTAVAYRENGGGAAVTDPDLAAGGPQVGDTFRLQVADRAVLKLVDPRFEGGNPYFCAAAASAEWHQRCNA